MARLKTMHLLILFIILYLITCYFVYKAVDSQLAKSTEYQRWKQSAGYDEWPVLSIKKTKNGSWQFLQEHCPVYLVVKHSHLSSQFSSTNLIRLTDGVCMHRPDPLYHQDNNIVVMEDLWHSLDVGYPQYVYTVSGWIQVIEVDSYTARPALHVIVVPHSHQDIVQQLSEHKDWTFIWAEIALLSRWYWEASEEQRKTLKQVIATGQMEIATGGWVMTEEACAHFAPMLDQLIEGHLWLKEELGIVPNASWSVDPFGHSPTMAYLLRGSGIKNMVIQRVHYAIKRHLAKLQQMEFDWRQSWDDSGSTDIFCHMMPFLSYSILYSCGPDPHVCCQFDFVKKKCFHGTRSIEAVPVSEENIKKLAWQLWEQFQKKAQLYQNNVILVPHGDDFRYEVLSEWDRQLGNMQKLMNYMNADRDMNIKVEFGTISDYFNAVAAERKKLKVSNLPEPPTFVGDFFPYNDRDDQYWTGFYSSRPFYKYMARVLQGRLRSTEILYTVVLAQLIAARKTDLLRLLEKSYSDLQDARRDQATFMHHDAITGTSKNAVVKDFADILQRALSKVDSTFKMLLSVTLTQDSKSQELFKMNEHWPLPTSLPVRQEAGQSTKTVIVTNPLTTHWVYMVKVRVLDDSLRVISSSGKPVRQQLSPVWNQEMAISESVLEIIFEADMPPLSIQTFELKTQQTKSKDYASIRLHNMDTFTPSDKLPFKITKSTAETFTVENPVITATFSACTGLLQHILRKSDDQGHKVEVQFLTYSTGSWTNPFRDKSGAYIFMPNGIAQDLEVRYPGIAVVEGAVSSSVYTFFPGVLHIATVYNVTGPVGAGVYVENTANMNNASWNNKELVMRLKSDLHNAQNDVCVDLNGFQMTRKQWLSKKLIQGNFHPVNTMAFINDDRHSRLTLVMAQAHGLASLYYGWLEVVLDRRLMQDDWRGMGEGILDNVPTPSKFVILLERRDKPATKIQVSSYFCRPSLLAELTSEHLNNPPVITQSQLSLSSLANQGAHTFLNSPLPCSLNLVNFRTVSVDQKLLQLSALMVVHHAGVDCMYSDVLMQCEMNGNLHLGMLKGIQEWRAVETSLTASVEISPHSAREVNIPEMELRAYKFTFF